MTYTNITISRLELEMSIIMLFVVKSQDEQGRILNIFQIVIVTRDICPSLYMHTEHVGLNQRIIQTRKNN